MDHLGTPDSHVSAGPRRRWKWLTILWSVVFAAFALVFGVLWVSQTILPQWFLILLFAISALAPWMWFWSRFRFRYSLRSLFIVTTVVAVVLGFVAWQVRLHSAKWGSIKGRLVVEGMPTEAALQGLP